MPPIFLILTHLFIMYVLVSEHAYAMPSTVESLGKKLAETKESVDVLVNKTALQRTNKCRLQKKIKSLQEALTGKVTINFQIS
jgi:hypothetical protein